MEVIDRRAVEDEGNRCTVLDTLVEKPQVLASMFGTPNVILNQASSPFLGDI